MSRTSSALGRAGPLLAARVVVAVFGIAIPMVLARLLVPAEYGTFKQAWLLSSTLFTLLPFGVTQSLLFFVPRDARNQGGYVSHVLAGTWAVGGLAALALWLGGGSIAALFHNPELGALMPAVAAITAFRLGGQSWDFVYLAEGRVGAAAWIKAGYETFYTVCVAAAALMTHSVSGALWAIALATGLRALMCTVDLIRRFGFRLQRKLLVAQLKYALPFGLAFALLVPQQQFHLYAVSAAVPAAAFALYSVGCLQLPFIEMFYTPISDVMQLAIAEEDARGQHDAAIWLFRDAVSRLSFAFIPLMGLLLVVAPQLIRFFFTDRYAGAVHLFRITLLSIPLAALPLEGLMRARAQNRFMLLVSIAKFGSTVLFVLMGLKLFGLTGALVGFMLSEEVGRGLLFWRSAHILHARIAQLVPLKELAQRMLAAAVGAGGAALGVRVPGPLIVELFAAGIAFAALYLGALALLGGLPPMREWIPMRSRPRAEETALRNAA